MKWKEGNVCSKSVCLTAGLTAPPTPQGAFLSELSNSIKREHSYPHPSVSYCWPIFCQSQHVQIHFVLPPSTDTESKSFGSFLHVHSEIIKILWGWGENRINNCLISEKLPRSVPLFSFSLIVNVFQLTRYREE